ncbi:M42 family metallopeptidase [Rubeoparvulum massiliense]|uniref:M42 family metallopeptidase n=1 Tax=Rubeoparvulum massiliense TaxID=1631346 RepID=UPI0036F209C4
MAISVEYMVNALVKLTSIPSPTGNTGRAIAWLEQTCKQLGVETRRNHKGGLLLTLPGVNDEQQRFLTAHVDTLGAMVKEIKSNGRLLLSMIGGFRWNAVEGEYVEVETSDGQRFTGTILLKHASVHVYKDAGSMERSDDNMEVRLDVDVKNADEVRALGIAVGDFVSFDPRTQVTESGYIKSRHIDDKASAAILLGVMKYLQEEKIALPYTTHILFSNNEEIGYGGNSNIPERVVEYLSVDMGAIGEGQTTDEHCVSICAKDSSGPYHYGLRKRLVELAKQEELYYQVDIYPYYGSDASAAMRSGHDLVHGLIGPGVDASHANERTHQDAMVNTARLVLAYLLDQRIGG